MNGKVKFVRFFNHYIGADCASFEDVVEFLETVDSNENGEGMYSLIEVVEQYFREEE